MSRLSPLSLSSLVSPNLTDVKNVAAENQKIYILFSFTNASNVSNESWELESVDAFLIVLEMHFYYLSDVSNNMRVGRECTDVDVGLIFV